ncbi:glycogen/starch synthase [bacterium]|nr:glycogen/starch synthase [bacterium]
MARSDDPRDPARRDAPKAPFSAGSNVEESPVTPVATLDETKLAPRKRAAKPANDKIAAPTIEHIAVAPPPAGKSDKAKPAPKKRAAKPAKTKAAEPMIEHVAVAPPPTPAALKADREERIATGTRLPGESAPAKARRAPSRAPKKPAPEPRVRATPRIPRARGAKRAPKHVLMVASENGALRGGSVGGIADVIRDLPGALVEEGLKVTVITPAYGYLHADNEVMGVYQVNFPFASRVESADVFRVRPTREVEGVQHLVVENIWIRGNPIYVHDPWEPFSTDAAKFAMFSAAVASLVASAHETVRDVDVIHLHDWHAAFVALLRELDPQYADLQRLRTVFTIHNLGIQGTRPVEHAASSLSSWYPSLFADAATRDLIYRRFVDGRYQPPCFNPMAAGIALSDIVTTVSPTYAREITRPSDADAGVFGGEGLEDLIGEAMRDKRLVGILNGYDAAPRSEQKLSFAEIRDALEREAARMADSPVIPETLPSSLRRLREWRELSPRFVATLVTRVADQKTRLFFERGMGDATAGERILDTLAAANGVFVLVGDGLPLLCRMLGDLMDSYPNFLFLQGRSDDGAAALYAGGDLFLMPSLYEPCGIAQMIAMRHGQPPLVHEVGGLADTVKDGVNGFAFDGATIEEKVEGFVGGLTRALRMSFEEPEAWKTIVENARAARFAWRDAAKKYVKDVYTG